MFRNHEGYADPTAGRACANIDRAARKALAEQQRAMDMAVESATCRKRRRRARRKKNRHTPKIGVMRW